MELPPPWAVKRRDERDLEELNKGLRERKKMEENLRFIWRETMLMMGGG